MILYIASTCAVYNLSIKLSFSVVKGHDIIVIRSYVCYTFMVVDNSLHEKLLEDYYEKNSNRNWL